MINQSNLVAQLDAYFNVQDFNESHQRNFFPAGYASIFEQHATPSFWQGSWNGLMLDNAQTINTVYLCVFPAQDVIDTILAREVERGSPGAMIIAHHLADYQETGPGYVFISESQLEDLRDNQISYYSCHAPLDCHPLFSTSTALANALHLKEQVRFAAYHGGLSGVHGVIPTIGFGEFARKCADATGLPKLRFSALRHNGLPVSRVGVIGGAVMRTAVVEEAIALGCDTLVTGEWWLFGPGEWRAQRREAMRQLLASNANINLIGTTHYASEAVLMRDLLPIWFREQLPTIEAVFIPQSDPWR